MPVALGSLPVFFPPIPLRFNSDRPLVVVRMRVMRRRILVVLMLLVSCGSALAEEGLGRLFLSPAERATLEGLRASGQLAPEPSTPPAGEGASALSADAGPPACVTFNGILLGPDGPRALWVDGHERLRPLVAVPPAAAQAVGVVSAAPLVVFQTGKDAAATALRPGETWRDDGLPAHIGGECGGPPPDALPPGVHVPAGVSRR